MNIFRLVLAMVLVGALFLPLSKCEYHGIMEDGNLEEPVITIRYLIPESIGAYKYLWIVPFLLPAIYSIHRYKYKNTIASEIGHFLVIAPAITVIYWHKDTGTLMIGGYLASTSLGCLLFIALGSIYLRVNKYSKPTPRSDSV